MALQTTTDKNSYLRDEARQSEMRVAQTALVARMFEEAATSFQALSASATGPSPGVSAVWGEAIARFAYGASSRAAFERVAAGLGSGSYCVSEALWRVLGLFADRRRRANWRRCKVAGERGGGVGRH